jgi:glycosyltransferase involved in cell wall biosynthesis
MKIIVSHDGKQHVNALLTGLGKRGVLTHFFTSIATNKLSFTHLLSEKWRKKLNKRAFTNVDSRLITHFPTIAILTNFFKSEHRRIFTVYQWFDKIVAKRLKTMDFDIVIGHENSNLQSFKTAKQREKITVLDFCAIHHNFQKTWLAKLGTYQNQAELDEICAHKDAAFGYTDYILALSSFAEKTLIDNGFPAKRIFKTYLGVNHTVFKPKMHYNLPKKGIYTEGSPFFENRPFELYFVGTMTNRKGLPFLIDVHKKLLKLGLNVRLTLIGPPDDFAPPPEETPNYRYFSFLNHAELVEMHHNLDLFAFPSYLDSWAQVVIEAMACGSPALVSENTGAKDAVEKGGGFVLPVDDLMAWVTAIETFYHDRFLLEQMGRKAAEIAKTYTWEAYHEQVFEAMTTIFKQRIQAAKQGTGTNKVSIN